MTGVESVSPSKLESLPKFQKRSIWKPWAKHPLLDLKGIEEGLESMKRMLEIQGFYDAKMDLTWVKSKHWIAKVHIEEGKRAPCVDVTWLLEDGEEELPYELKEKLEP